MIIKIPDNGNECVLCDKSKDGKYYCKYFVNNISCIGCSDFSHAIVNPEDCANEYSCPYKQILKMVVELEERNKTR